VIGAMEPSTACGVRGDSYQIYPRSFMDAEQRCWRFLRRIIQNFPMSLPLGVDAIMGVPVLPIAD